MFGIITYYVRPANRWKDDTHSEKLIRCLTLSYQEGVTLATELPASLRKVKLSVRSEVDTPTTQDHAKPASKPSQNHTTKTHVTCATTQQAPSNLLSERTQSHVYPTFNHAIVEYITTGKGKHERWRAHVPTSSGRRYRFLRNNGAFLATFNPYVQRYVMVSQ